MKSTYLITGAVLALLLGGVWLSSALRERDPSILARNGLHWHPQLEIIVNDERVVIPENVGVGTAYAGMPTYDARMGMAAIHTHEDMPLIHMEFPGIVRVEDTILGNFFEIWGKDIREFGTRVTMTVNGVESSEFENYRMPASA